MTRPDCRCGHTAEAHDHYRPGTDCSALAAARGARHLQPVKRCRCTRYRAAGIHPAWLPFAAATTIRLLAQDVRDARRKVNR